MDNYKHGNGARQSDPRSSEELIAVALSPDDEDAAWDAVSTLHFRGTRDVFEAARLLCRSESARERESGANILGQLGIPERSFPDETLVVLLDVLAHEEHTGVLESVGIALGHLKDPRAVEPLVRFKNHASPRVRYGVVAGLSQLDDALAIHTLIELMEDSDEHVRDWATFGIGSMIDADNPEIRDALASRLADHDPVTRAEAMTGLARRGDPRLVDPLRKELLLLRDVCFSWLHATLVFEAAAKVAHPSLCPVLLDLQEIWDWESIDEAISNCTKTSSGTHTCR